MAISDDVTFFPKTLAWNSNTWDNDNAGTITFEFGESSETSDFKSGVDLYNRIIAETGRMPTVRITLAKILPITLATDKGATDDMVLTFQGATSTDLLTVNGADMKLIDIQSRQGRGTASECVLDFVHVSSDGSTPPFTVGA